MNCERHIWIIFILQETTATCEDFLDIKLLFLQDMHNYHRNTELLLYTEFCRFKSHCYLEIIIKCQKQIHKVLGVPSAPFLKRSWTRSWPQSSEEYVRNALQGAFSFNSGRDIFNGKWVLSATKRWRALCFRGTSCHTRFLSSRSVWAGWWKKFALGLRRAPANLVQQPFPVNYVSSPKFITRINSGALRAPHSLTQLSEPVKLMSTTPPYESCRALLSRLNCAAFCLRNCFLIDFELVDAPEHSAWILVRKNYLGDLSWTSTHREIASMTIYFIITIEYLVSAIIEKKNII